MATNSTSRQNSDPPAAAGCPRCGALAECNADLLTALRAALATLERIKKMRLDTPAHELAKALYEEIKPTESMARAAIEKAS